MPNKTKKQNKNIDSTSWTIIEEEKKKEKNSPLFGVLARVHPRLRVQCRVAGLNRELYPELQKLPQMFVKLSGITPEY